MFKRFKTRGTSLERLDTGDYTTAEYARWQREMRMINRFLGDTRAIRLSLKQSADDEQPVSILDVGAGAGDVLIGVGRRMRETPTLLTGIEISHDAARTINSKPGLTAVLCDARRLPFADDSFDFVISSLFLHHLTDDQAVGVIAEAGRVARRRFFIVDLHRHPAAFYMYRILAPLFLQKFTVEDGSLSIARSFKPRELLRLAQKARITDARVRRRAAFRLVLSGSTKG